MLHDRNIAFFIDVDNAVMESVHYQNVIGQLREMGEIVYGAVYGVSERKHKQVIEDAKNCGYAIHLQMRNRRRVRKVFDSRIFVDVADLVAGNPLVDTVAVVSAPDDLVYLFSHLHRKGKMVVSTDNLDEASASLADATVDLGKVHTVKLPANKAKTPKKEQQPAPVQSQPAENVQEDRTTALLREIERLRQDYDAPSEQPISQPSQSDVASLEQTQKLMKEIASLQQETPVQSQPETVSVEAQTAVEDTAVSEEQHTPVTNDDGDLIKKIEDLRQSNGGDSDDLVAEIKKLLDGLE